MKKLIISNILSFSILAIVILANEQRLLDNNLFRASSALAFLPIIFFYRKTVHRNNKIHLVFAWVVLLCAATIVNQDNQQAIWPLLVFIPIAAFSMYRIYASLNISLRWQDWWKRPR